MRRLRGSMVRAGVGLGGAAVLRVANTPPPPPPAMAAKLLRDPTGETLERVDVVLVADSYEEAARLALPWARVTAIAAERQYTGDVLAPVPAVAGVEGLLESVEADEALILIDGDRAMVLVEPDADTLAAFQAAREQIGPRRRLYLEYVHQPAATTDGRRIRVMAAAGTLAEVRQAVDAGADALYLPAGSTLLAACGDPYAAQSALSALADAAGGKPVTLAGDAETVDAASLLQIARRLDAVLAAPGESGPEYFGLLRKHLEETGAALLADSVEYGDVLIALRVPFGHPLPAPIAEYRAGRVVVEGNEDARLAGHPADWLSDLADQAAGLLLPVEAVVPGGDAQATELFAALGAAGVIVPPAAVQPTKDVVRGLDLAASRARLLGSEGSAP